MLTSSFGRLQHAQVESTPTAEQTQGVASNKRRKRCPRFSAVEDRCIAWYIQNCQNDWDGCAEYLKQFGREATAHQVHDRFYHSVRNIRGDYTAVEFTPELDALILESVKKFSHSWGQIAKLMPPFLPYQVMNRYNFLMKRNQNS